MAKDETGATGEHSKKASAGAPDACKAETQSAHFNSPLILDGKIHKMQPDN